MTTEKSAKAFVLRQAASWIEDQTGEASSVILIDETGEYCKEKVKAALALSKQLYIKADKIDASVKQQPTRQEK